MLPQWSSTRPFSQMTTFSPASSAGIAAIVPATPPPTTSKSVSIAVQFCSMGSLLRALDSGLLSSVAEDLFPLGDLCRQVLREILRRAADRLQVERSETVDVVLVTPHRHDLAVQARDDGLRQSRRRKQAGKSRDDQP